MALSAAYLAALATANPSLKDGNLWLELEGLPYGFGLNAKTSAWFSGRSAQYQREGVLSVFMEVPQGIEQEAKPREGDASIGSLSVKLAEEDTGAVLGLAANTGRQDGWIFLGAPRWKANKAYVSTGDVVRPTLTGGGAGAGKWFRCTTSGTSHATTEPTWPSGGTVADGTVVWTAEANQNLPANATQVAKVPFSGTAGTSLTLYLGRETLKAASKTQGNGCGYFSTVDRARYLMEGQVSAWAHDDGDVIATYPRFAVTRRGRLYAALQACADTDKLARWSGVVSRIRMGDGLRGVEVELASTWEQLSRKRFTGQRLRRLARNASSTEFDLTIEDGANWYQIDGLDKHWWRCDDEFFWAQMFGNAGVFSLRIEQGFRGYLKTTPAPHSAGADIRECIIVGQLPPGDFIDWPKGDNPLSVLLQIWLSKKGDGANGAYDVLPEGLGVGLDQSFVDVAGIEAVRDRWIPTARIMLVIEEPYDPREFTTKLLRPFGCYPALLSGDKLTVRRRAPPMPDTVIRTLTSAQIRKITHWEQDVLTQPVGLLFEADKEILTDDYRQRYAVIFTGPGMEAEEFYGQDSPTVEVQARGLYSGAPGFEWNSCAEDAAVELGEMARDRDATPAPIVTVECDYSVQDLEQGDFVSVSDNEIPNVLTGSRGVTAAPFEVLARTVDDERGCVVLKLQQIPRPGNTRLLAPSAIAYSIDAGTRRFYPHEHLFSPSSGARDLMSFVLGDVVNVRSPDLQTLRGTITPTVEAVVDGVAGTGYVQLSAWPTGTAIGDVLVLGSYSGQTVFRRGRNAFLGDAGLPALVGSDPAHEYA